MDEECHTDSTLSGVRRALATGNTCGTDEAVFEHQTNDLLASKVSVCGTGHEPMTFCMQHNESTEQAYTSVHQASVTHF